jgi:hypothetical protein
MPKITSAVKTLNDSASYAIGMALPNANSRYTSQIQDWYQGLVMM